MKTLIILFAFLFIQNISMAQLKPSCDSLIKVGVNQFSERNHLASLENLIKAFVMAKENRWHDQSFLALNNIGANYYTLLNYGEALHYYLEAYETAIKYLDQEWEMIVNSVINR